VTAWSHWHHRGRNDLGAIVERQARFGEIAAARAQTLQTAQPTLEALYQALSPEQKAVLDHPMNGEGRHGWRRQEFRHQPILLKKARDRRRAVIPLLCGVGDGDAA